MRQIVCVVLGCVWAGVALSEEGDMQAGCKPRAFSDVRRILETPAEGLLLPELEDFDADEVGTRAFLTDLIENIQRPPGPIPLTTYNLYRDFRKTGRRQPYETPYFEKRSQLAHAALAYWLLRDESLLDSINDLIWSICEETTWVLPAHERGPHTIDLFSAETASELAHVVYVLGDRLPEEVRMRACEAVKARALDWYLDYGRDYGWDSGRNNWTGVCAGSLGEAFLLLEPDLDRVARSVTLAVDQLDRFLSHAFEEDGGCLEGIGYWNYGLLHFVAYAEMLRARTNGVIDLMADPRLPPIAQYPLAVAIGPGRYVSFADSREHQSLYPFVKTRLAERTGVASLADLEGRSGGWRFGVCLRDMLWGKDPSGSPPLVDALLPSSGIVKRVGNALDGRIIVLAAKAGHNAEPHNHNDVGSFIVSVGDTTYLCDPGAGLYTRDYFGPKRYENVFASSYGHSVPRIGGIVQSPGHQFRGALERVSDKAFRIEFGGAYEAPGLRSLSRTIHLEDRGDILLEDVFVFEGSGLEIEEAFVTWLDVEADGATARICSSEGCLELRCEEGAAFAVERLEKASRENRKEGVLTRLTAVWPAAPQREVRVRMTFSPVK